MSAEEAATTTREAEEAEEPVAPGGAEETPAVEDTTANDAEASPRPPTRAKTPPVPKVPPPFRMTKRRTRSTSSWPSGRT